MKVYIIEVAENKFLTDTMQGLDATDKIRLAERFEKITHIKRFCSFFPNLYRALCSGLYKIRRYNIPDNYEIVDPKELRDADFSN